MKNEMPTGNARLSANGGQCMPMHENACAKPSTKKSKYLNTPRTPMETPQATARYDLRTRRLCDLNICRPALKIGRISLERLVGIDAKLSLSLRFAVLRRRGAVATHCGDRGGFPPMTVSLFYLPVPFISVLRFEIPLHPLRIV